MVVTGDSYNGTNYFYYTAKYATADGVLLWEKISNRAGEAVAVAVDTSGNVVVFGFSYSSTSGYDYYTVKYAAANGALLWERSYNGPNNDQDWNDYNFSRRTLALGPNGMVAVTGWSYGASSYDYATVVYWENLPPISMALIPAGVRLQFTGIASRQYNVQRALAPTGPWSTIATPTAPLNGFIEYIDTNPAASNAFYRASTPGL